MKCLCCGKEFSSENLQNGWHKRCIRNFFGTDKLPVLEVDKEHLEILVENGVQKGLTVPGVQKKMSLHLFSDAKKPRLTMVNYPTGYILKPQVEEFEALPEAEQLVMSMADKAGIATVPHALMPLQDELAYITRRVDRIWGKNGVAMLAMEDFCQLDLRLTQDKYKGSYERCTKIIDKYSSTKGLDRAEMFMRLVFSFMVGNSDMHLKNFSLIESEEGSGEYHLSPAYDLLPVNVVMPEDKEQFALTMNGKKLNIRRKDFFVFAEECGLQKASAEKMIEKFISMKELYTGMCEQSLLPEYMKERFCNLIEERTKILQGDT